MNESSYVKNLGQVSAIIFGKTPPELTFILWFDENESLIKYYDLVQKDWVPVTGNLSTGANTETDSGGLVFKEKVGSVLFFRRIKGENGIAVTTEGDDIVVRVQNFLEVSPSEVFFDSKLAQLRRLRISSNLQWEILGADLISWLSFSVTEGFGSQFVSMTVETLNPTIEEREAFIILRDPTEEIEDISIRLVQMGADIYVSSFTPNPGDFQCDIK